jgi:hypothetical protein
MKIQWLSAIFLLAIACNNNSTPSNQNAVQNPDSMRQDKTQVHIDTIEEMTFRQHEEELIKENNKKIAELRAKIKNEKKAIGEKYNEQLDTLDQENVRMETRLNGFSEQTKADWKTFKYNFNRDMDSLGKSISRFAEKNMSNDKQH